jgi:hypothetical protein
MGYPSFTDTGGLSSTTGSGITVTHPTTVNVNDWLMLIIVKDYTSSVAITTPPSGYTLQVQINDTTNNTTMVVYYQRAAGDEGGTNVNLQWTEAAATVTAGEIYRYANVLTTASPFDFGYNSEGNSTSVNVDGGTTLGSQRLLVNYTFILGVNDDTQTSCTNASGWSESEYNFGSTGNDVGIKVQERQVPTATTITDQTSTLGGTRKWISTTYSLTPEPGWSHNFLGIVNANIKEISGELTSNIQSVNSIE